MSKFTRFFFVSFLSWFFNLQCLASMVDYVLLIILLLISNLVVSVNDAVYRPIHCVQFSVFHGEQLDFNGC